MVSGRTRDRGKSRATDDQEKAQHLADLRNAEAALTEAERVFREQADGVEFVDLETLVHNIAGQDGQEVDHGARPDALRALDNVDKAKDPALFGLIGALVGRNRLSDDYDRRWPSVRAQASLSVRSESTEASPDRRSAPSRQGVTRLGDVAPVSPAGVARSGPTGSGVAWPLRGSLADNDFAGVRGQDVKVGSGDRMSEDAQAESREAERREHIRSAIRRVLFPGDEEAGGDGGTRPGVSRHVTPEGKTLWVKKGKGAVLSASPFEDISPHDDALFLDVVRGLTDPDHRGTTTVFDGLDGQLNAIRGLVGAGLTSPDAAHQAANRLVRNSSIMANLSAVVDGLRRGFPGRGGGSCRRWASGLLRR